MYHCPTTMINIVRTKGKAGYLDWKLAVGQGDQDINLPWGSLEITFFFDFCETELFVAKPLLIIKSIYSNKNILKGCMYFRLNLEYLFIERRGSQL